MVSGAFMMLVTSARHQKRSDKAELNRALQTGAAGLALPDLKRSGTHGGQRMTRSEKRGGHTYLRITFSDGVNASMYAGLEKIRSAYLSSGAAFFDRSMP